MSNDRFDGAAKKVFGHVQDAVGGLTGDTKTQAEGKLNQVSGSIQETVGRVTDQASDAFDQTKNIAQDLGDNLQDWIKDKPIMATGVVLGAGLLVGMLLRGGRKTVYLRK